MKKRAAIVLSFENISDEIDQIFGLFSSRL